MGKKPNTSEKFRENDAGNDSIKHKRYLFVGYRVDLISLGHFQITDIFIQQAHGFLILCGMQYRKSIQFQSHSDLE